MAQHDYNIADQLFAPFRADLNNALLAIVTGNSGVTAPANTFAGMIWIDLSGANPIVKQRNGANTDWITLYTLSAALALLTNAGGILNGFLTLHADPTQSFHAATKQYVDAQRDTRLALSGGILSNFLTLHADPTLSNHAVTKNYVDAKVFNLQIFEASGTFNVPNGITKVLVTCVGGGGGGGGGAFDLPGGAGGTGGVGSAFLVVTPGAAVSVIVGPGGVGNNSGAGSPGGASSFLTLSATGGIGGSASNGFDPGVAGNNGSASGTTPYLVSNVNRGTRGNGGAGESDQSTNDAQTGVAGLVAVEWIG